MRRTILGFVAAAALWAGALKGQQEVELQAAIRTEMVDGDLKAAIQQYGAIVARYKEDRAVAAKALIRMAECYQKMGDAEAQKIYERVIREYADQKEAVARARARLGPATASNSGGSIRQLWTKRGGAPYGPMSPDGRYVAFTSYEAGGPTGGVPNVAVHDFRTGADVVLTGSRNPKDHPTRTGRAFSPDSKQIAYPWVIIDNGEEHSEIRISEVSGNSSAKPRVLFRTENRLSAEDWSPDGKWIALEMVRKDGTTQLGLVSTADGSLRVLKSVDWTGATKVYFSPDSRFVAFDLQAGERSESRDVFVLAVDGSRQVPAVTHPADDRVAGWTPDGKRILYERLMRSESAIVERDVTSGAELEIVRIKTLRNQNSYTRSFLLSPDGRSLAYLTSDGTSVHTAIMLKPLARGEPRELLKLNEGVFLHGWTPDGQSLLYGRRDRATGGGTASPGVAAWLLPIGGGEPRRLDLGESFVSQVQLHPDGKQIAFWCNNQTGEQIWVLENHLPTLTVKK